MSGDQRSYEAQPGDRALKFANRGLRIGRRQCCKSRKSRRMPLYGIKQLIIAVLGEADCLFGFVGSERLATGHCERKDLEVDPGGVHCRQPSFSHIADLYFDVVSEIAAALLEEDSESRVLRMVLVMKRRRVVVFESDDPHYYLPSSYR
jgi:hypothetical protein